MAECNSIDHSFHETPNMYPNMNVIPLNTVPLSDQQQFRLNSKLLQRLKKEN